MSFRSPFDPNLHSCGIIISYFAARLDECGAALESFVDWTLREVLADAEALSRVDVVQRLGQHNAGISKSTKHWRPWELVHQEAFETRAEAMTRERFLKSGKVREELDRILADYRSAG